MPSLMTCSLIYQLSVTPELRRHLRLFNIIKKQEVKAKVEGENRREISINIKGIYELKQQHQQLLPKQQKSQNDCLQKILKKAQKLKHQQQQQQHKRRRWVLSCNLITILKQIKLTNPTFDIQQLQQKLQQQHCQKHQKPQLQQQQQQQQQQQHLLKI